ncbi:hypothetical protein OG785_40625 [Streptomyces sp. NBC_00006]|uniref:hypothetical protein n=1 Tax=unclassified Streptomyces TaxID=2593676 RepID=UPI002257E489|nr:MULTISPECIES: hypothetical protein [unclassified Streptomyces]MCX4832319.1 hypothetical protein [Streptomyces sp. NBC_01016]MCX4835943.1 hypothetical protein [Streptomyces sp. NBC_01016]MCX5536843.1 hypothetical protein [Streptomyces sp. NBC_00006]MCX5536856.1 hypothetical protein [Streptomyces sp. NBC_00006]
MKPPAKRRLKFVGVVADPPKPLTVLEIVVNVATAVMVFGALGFITGKWDMAIGAGVSGTGVHLLFQWWWRRSDRPEHNEGEDG